MFSQDNLPLRVIQITRKRPEWRTEEEVKFVQSCLQEIESYGSYSLRLQFLLAKVVRFEWFERGRVILKKGQCGISFYFIYFGSVALTDDEDGSSTLTALYPVVLQKGAKFGEVSVLKGTRRVATVICLEDTKLFVVDKDDFFANKLDEELQEELCYRYNFIKGVKFFEKWSKRSIVRITNSSKMEKFYYGQVITKDITKSDSVILISKGTCEILHLVDLTACPSYHKWVCRQLTHLPKVPCLTRKTGKLCSLAGFLWKLLNNHQVNNSELYCPWYLCILLYQHFFPDHMQDRRNMVLVSKDAEVIWLKKDTFEKLLDLGKVLELHKRYPSDDELCQKFLEENQWKMIKKDLTSSIIQRKCAPKITPVFEKPGEHVHNSWTINQAGILDLSMLHHKHQQYPHRFVPVYMEPTRQQPVMPEAKLRLIHSIISPHTCLKGLF
uniref:Cyclic nucleotide-binding domain-containing protein 2 n=1 Tax=Nothoprocta perdicaria TaxID=30464 RepID=A0A8C7ECJ0_NOTPE